MKTNNYKYESAVKAINYLSSKGWQFDYIKRPANEFKRAFNCGDYNSLASGAAYLLKNDWVFNNFNDLKLLNEARKVYRKSLMRYENEAYRQQRDW